MKTEVLNERITEIKDDNEEVIDTIILRDMQSVDEETGVVLDSWQEKIDSNGTWTIREGSASLSPSQKWKDETQPPKDMSLLKKEKVQQVMRLAGSLIDEGFESDARLGIVKHYTCTLANQAEQDKQIKQMERKSII